MKFTIIYCIFLICLVLSSSIAFPLLSNQSFAQAPKGTCASAAEKEAKIRPVVYYSIKPLTVGSDNRYFVYIYNPQEYGKNIEVKVDGVSNWWVEELYPNTALKSGDSVIVKSSTAFIIHGTSFASECSCKVSQRESPVDRCSSGCENVGIACNSNADCKSGESGLRLTPSDFSVRFYGTENAKELVGSVGILQQQVLGLTDKEILDSLFKVTLGASGIVVEQLRGAYSTDAYIEYGTKITVIAPEPNTPWPGRSNIPQSWIHKFSNLNEAYKFLAERWKNAQVETGAWKFGKNGAITEILDLPPGDIYNVDGTRYIFGTRNFNIIKDFKSNGYQYLGFDHQHIDTASNLRYRFSAGDMSTFYSDFNYLDNKIAGYFSIYSKEYGFTHYVLFKADIENYITYRYNPDSGKFDYRFPDNGNSFYEASLRYRDQIRQVSSASKIIDINIKESKAYGLNEWLNDYIEIYSRMKKAIQTNDLNSFSQVVTEYNDLKQSIPAGIDQDWANINKNMLNAADRMISSFQSERTLSPRVIETMQIYGGASTDGLTELMLRSQQYSFEFSNELSGMGYSPPENYLTSEFKPVADGYILKMEKLNAALDNPSMNKAAESLDPSNNAADPINAARNSPKYGPLVVGIGSTLLLSSSPILREYGNKIQDANYVMAADAIDKVGWGLLASSIVVTIAGNIAAESVPTVVITYLSLGTGLAEIASNFITGFGIGIIVSSAINYAWCKYDSTSFACGCSPDPLFGKAQLELEKNTITKGEKINFAIYGMQHCAGTNAFGFLKTNVDWLNPYKGVKGVESYPCNFNEKGCCESRVEVTLDAGTYDKIQGSIASIPEMNEIASTDYQTLIVTGGVTTLQCNMENEKSWICESTQGYKIHCIRDTFADRLTWNCEAVS